MKVRLFRVMVLFLLYMLPVLSWGQNIQWTRKNDMPRAVRNGRAVACNGKVYFMGGYCAQTKARFEASNYEYDPAADAWTQRADMPVGRSNFIMVTLDDRIHVIGGDPFSPHHHVYDPETDSWTTRQPMLTPRQHLNGTVVNGMIYAIGGLMPVMQDSVPADWSYKNVTNLAEVYDPATDSWSSCAPMPTRRHDINPAVVDGKIYIMGGMGTEADMWKTISIVEVYDPATDTWERLADLPEPRDGYGMAVYHNKIYVIGGFNPDGIANTVLVYDPAKDQWQENGVFPNNATGSPGWAVLDNRVYIIGGSDDQYKANANLYQGLMVPVGE